MSSLAPQKQKSIARYKFNQGLQLYLVQTEEELNDLVYEIEGYDIVSIDFESNGKPIKHKDFKTIGFSVSVDPYRGWYIPYAHENPEQMNLFVPEIRQLRKETVFDALRFVWKTKKLVNHEIKYDIKCLHREGEEPVKYWKESELGGGVYFDTYIAQKVLNDLAKENDQKSLTRRLISRDPINYTDITGKDRNFAYVPLDTARDYAAADPPNCMAIYEVFMRLLSIDDPFFRGCRNVLFEYEFPLISEIAEAEMQGIRLDMEKIDLIHKMTSEEMTPIEEEMKKLVYSREPDFEKQFGKPFDPNSNQLLLATLTDIFGVYETYESVTEEALLQALESMSRDRHKKPDAIKFIELVLKWREPQKIRSTYSINLAAKSIDGILYPELDQVGAASGRFSSRNPNGQNFPKSRSRFPVRESMLPVNPDYTWVIADYKAMEMFITAAESRCPILRSILMGQLTIFDKLDVRINDPKRHYENKVKKLLSEHVPEAKALEEAKKIDIHLYTGAYAFKKPYDELSSEERDKAKVVNFGIIYGISEYSLARQLGVSEEEAKSIIKGYFQAYPTVYRWIQSIQDEVFRKGYITTYQGRSRHVPEHLLGKDRYYYKDVFRWACNHKIQGFSGMETKKAMKRLAVSLRKNNLNAKLTLQIHDELFVVSPRNEAETVGKLMVEAMRIEHNGIVIEADGFKICQTLSKG